MLNPIRNPVLLVAEDNPSDVLLLQRALKRAGSLFQMVRVADGDEAIAYLQGTGAFGNRQAHPVPQVMLLDLRMPGTDGFGVLQWRQQSRLAGDVPVIVFSSSGLPEDVRRAYALGANSYVTKPNAPQRLERMVRILSDWWGDLNLTPNTSSLS